jgi:hypothetical protein
VDKAEKWYSSASKYSGLCPDMAALTEFELIVQGLAKERDFRREERKIKQK